MTLRALPGGRDHSVGVGLVSLESSPLRPGEMPARMMLKISLSEMWVGVPPGLQAVIGIEAAHAIERFPAAQSVELDLDRCAAAPRSRRLMVPTTRLADYAQQLMASSPRASAFRGEIELLPPSRLITAWRLGALASAKGLEEWMGSMLARAPRNAVRWEAAAAHDGLTLTEWLLLQALSA
jgi:hypothetical protein